MGAKRQCKLVQAQQGLVAVCHSTEQQPGVAALTSPHPCPSPHSCRERTLAFSGFTQPRPPCLNLQRVPIAGSVSAKQLAKQLAQQVGSVREPAPLNSTALLPEAAQH